MKDQFILYLLNKMTVSEKIGQMIMIDYRIPDVKTTEMTVDFEKVLEKYNPGGFILFRSNVSDFEGTKKLITEIKNSNDIPVMISTDQEGGKVQRLNSTNVGFEDRPPMYEIGQTLDKELAFRIGKAMGEELKSIGVDMDMAPVLDIFSNPENTVIAHRAFGSDAETVKKMSLSMADGLTDAGIIPVGKHFPGHGDTAQDSHIELPVIDKDLDELKAQELIPFIEAVKKKLPGLMIAHIAVPKITKEIVPATLTGVMVNDLLRKDLGYEGLIIPDSLKMKALTKYFTNEDIYLRCIGAGNDMLLMPQDVGVAHETLLRAVESGAIPMDRIDTSVYRILSTKFDYGFFNKEYSEYVNSHNKVR